MVLREKGDSGSEGEGRRWFRGRREMVVLREKGDGGSEGEGRQWF